MNPQRSKNSILHSIYLSISNKGLLPSPSQCGKTFYENKQEKSGTYRGNDICNTTQHEKIQYVNRLLKKLFEENTVGLDEE